MAKGGGEPTVGSNKGSNKVKYKLNLVLKLFGGIATDDEVKSLKPTRGKENATSSDMGARLVLARSSTCLRWRFEGCVHRCEVPRSATAPTDQPTQTEGELGGLSPWRSQETAQRVAVDLDKSTLRAWRSKHDAKKRRASVTSTGQTEEQQESPTASAVGGRRARSACEARWRAG
ncbi:hypothetical protein RI054_03g19070 [Pseudoscourfieldia marina]